MKADLIKRIQREGADALLDRGVSLPLADIRIFGRRLFTIRGVMRRPTLGAQIRIARLYLQLTTTAEELGKADKTAQMTFLKENGKTVSRMVAVTLTRGYIARHLFEGVTAWYLRQFVPPEYLLGAMMQFVLLLGTEGFINIIRSAAMTNPMKLRLSQKAKGSQRVNMNTPIAPSVSSGRLRRRRAGA